MLQPVDPLNPEHWRTIAAIYLSANGASLTVSPSFIQYNLQSLPGLVQEGRILFDENDAATGTVIASMLTTDERTSPRTHGWIDCIAVQAEYQGRGYGSELLDWAESWLREQGCTMVTLGAGIRTFVPGLPREASTESFFRHRGYVNSSQNDAGLVWDVANDLGKYEGSPSVIDIEGEVRPGKPGDEQHLLRLLAREFPGRWRFETEDYLRIGGRISDSMLLWTERGVDGFCWLTFEDSVRPMQRYYPYSLPRPWGQLGPIGVSADARSKGYGAAVLDSGLRRLRDTGVRGCVIDWTSLVDFYGKFGFEQYRAYIPMAKPLS